jgi:hypothetical protein
MERFRFTIPPTAAFPFRPQGRSLQLSDEATPRFAGTMACNFALGKLMVHPANQGVPPVSLWSVVPARALLGAGRFVDKRSAIHP